MEGFEAIIWSFLWEILYDYNITTVLHDITMLLPWQHLFIRNNNMSLSRFSQSSTQNHELYFGFVSDLILYQTGTAYAPVKVNILPLLPPPAPPPQHLT